MSLITLTIVVKVFKMSKKHLRIPNKTIIFNQKLLGEDYFANSTLSKEEIAIIPTKEEKLTTIDDLSKTLAVSEMFCAINANQTHYLATVDLFMAASYEKEHRKEILNKELKLKLKNFTNFLDIGTGKGELTKFIGQYFSNITVVDNSLESLSSLPDILGPLNSTVHKIHGSILNVDISQIKYDLILMSHTLYYIEDKYRITLFEDLYKSLNINGIIAIVYNDGLGREQLVKSFGGREEDFHNFFFNIMSTYKNSYALSSIEIIESQSIEPMLHVANMIIYDANGTTNIESLSGYLNDRCFDGNLYQVDMKQNFIFVGETAGVNFE